MSKAFRLTNDGSLAITMEDIASIDEDGMTVAVLRFNRDHGLNFMWMPFLFTNPETPLPDVVRAELIRLLRFHADKLESGDIDRRMKAITAEVDRGGKV